MKATIYIPDNQANLYLHAKERLGDSISSIFVRCLERELELAQSKTARIVVEIEEEDTSIVKKKAFVGRWLVGDETEGQEHYFTEEEQNGWQAMAGYRAYSVAITQKGAVVVVRWNKYAAKSFEHYPNFDEFKSANVQGIPRHPLSLVAAVADALHIEHVENLDI